MGHGRWSPSERIAGDWRLERPSLTEDTDLTYRLLLHGWKTAYQNRSECYEEVPETWAVRIKQIMRWAKGHNQAMVTYAIRLLLGRHRATLRERIDGALLLGVYAMAPVTILGWILALGVFFQGIAPLHGLIALFALPPTRQLEIWQHFSKSLPLSAWMERVANCLLHFLFWDFPSVFSRFPVPRGRISACHRN